ncbi:hypothetical protein, variant 1 [Exophiala mesophila]|uniref:Major facilitator superfamily (MFS) profile domain-containing protein n=2 Tax=Exophiala mesophila TaxID=212818 RepID=A0A0D1ZPK8_EXOME|nr:hypothetical protein, variant 1 [Exophiala mesophila]KIV96502.1 hypothetical protein, variant 1 [Exophiala mesophila]
MSSELTKALTAPEARTWRNPLSRSRSTPQSRPLTQYPPRFIDDFGSHSYNTATELESVRRASTGHDKPTSAHFSDEFSRDLESNAIEPEKDVFVGPVKNPNIVTWDSDDDGENPKNWSFRKKWAATLIVSAFTFISPVSSSMIAPALDKIGEEFHITSDLEKSLTLSAFVLAYAIGPLILGPLSEIYGRVIVIQSANAFFLAFNIGCGFAQSKSQLIAFRFLSGLGGSAPLALGGGVLSDTWRAEERGKSMSIYSLAPLLGPAVGPIAGGFIAMNTTWRWCFWATSIVDTGIQCLGYFYLRETYAPKILSMKAKRLRKETGNPDLRTEWEIPGRTLTTILATNLIRPFRLLGTQIIIQVIAIYMAYLYGLMYLVLATFPRVWAEIYDQSTGMGGLNYLSLGIGFFMGSQIAAPLNDRIYIALKKRNGGVGRPEFRCPLMVPGALLVPIGLFIYGWTARPGVHWIFPNIGAALLSAGTIMGFQCAQTYIVDAYQRFAASAIAAAVVLRSLAGFGFPLFAPYLYAALNLDWGNSLLGFVSPQLPQIHLEIAV